MPAEAPTRDYLTERYIAPAAKAMRAESISRMTDAGIWVEQAEYMMDTLFSADAPTFEAFLGQHPDLALALWPVRRGVDLRSGDRVVDTDTRMSDAARNWTAAIDRVYAERVRAVLTGAHKVSML